MTLADICSQGSNHRDEINIDAVKLPQKSTIILASKRQLDLQRMKNTGKHRKIKTENVETVSVPRESSAGQHLHTKGVY